MPTPILATKLYIPRLRPNVVSRPRLLERLNEGLSIEAFHHAVAANDFEVVKKFYNEIFKCFSCFSLIRLRL